MKSLCGNIDYIRKLSYCQGAEGRKMERAENNSFAYCKFKELCKREGITPYQVAVRSNGIISTAVLTQWKNAEYELKLDKLRAIAEVFGVPVTDFIE